MFFNVHERHIHFHIRRLSVPNYLYEEFYAEGISVLWLAYKQYDPKRSTVHTFVNYRIRYRLIDLLRKFTRQQKRDAKVIKSLQMKWDLGHRHGTMKRLVLGRAQLELKNEAFWVIVRSQLTVNQWKWVHYIIIAELTVREVMEIENVSAGAVKSWGREARRKLRRSSIKKKLLELV